MEDINIALLIDADNISSKYIPVILSELSKYGKITIRRMYGDWSQERLRSWLGCSAGYSLTPVMQPNNTPGKNASDIGLIIDAMDTLYADSVQGFCIVSSDGDFNKLATRLRESGKVVIGMGEKKTPESFRVSCERFIFLDVISGSSDMRRKNLLPDPRARTVPKRKTAPETPPPETPPARPAPQPETPRRNGLWLHRRPLPPTQAAPTMTFFPAILLPMRSPQSPASPRNRKLNLPLSR